MKGSTDLTLRHILKPIHRGQQWMVVESGVYDCLVCQLYRPVCLLCAERCTRVFHDGEQCWWCASQWWNGCGNEEIVEGWWCSWMLQPVTGIPAKWFRWVVCSSLYAYCTTLLYAKCYYFAPGRGVKYCDECLSVCLSVQSFVWKTAWPSFTKSFWMLTGCGSVLLWWCCDNVMYMYLSIHVVNSSV